MSKSLTSTVSGPKVEIVTTVAHKHKITLDGKMLGNIIDEMIEESRLRDEVEELLEITIRMPK